MSSSNPEKQAIVVLGMHRSGTSALTRVISILGAKLPDDLMKPDRYNEPGYWESNSLASLNDDILATAGTSWSDISPFPASWYKTKEAATLTHRALKLLEQQYGKSPLFVMKDPRISRILPFWSAVLRRFDAQPLPVHSLRHPLEVEASLRARDKFSPAKSALLWLQYVLEAEHQTRSYRRSELWYEDLLSDWPTLVTRVATELAIIWPRSPEEAKTEIASFLSDKHRHHVFHPEQLADQNPHMSWLSRAYNALKAPDSRGDRAARLDALREEIAVAEGAFRPLFSSLQRQLADLAEDMVHLAAGRAYPGTTVGWLTDEQSPKADLFAEQRNEIGHLKHELSSSETRVVELQKDLAERDRSVKAQCNLLEQRRSEIERLEGLLSKQKADQVLLQGDLTEHQKQVENLGQELSAGAANLARLQGHIEARDQSLAVQAEQLNALRDELGQLRRELSDSETSIAELQEELTARDETALKLRSALEDVSRKAQISDRTTSQLRHKLLTSRQQEKDQAQEIHQIRTSLSEMEGLVQTLQSELSQRNKELCDLTKELIRHRWQMRKQRLRPRVAILQAALHRMLKLLPGLRNFDADYYLARYHDVASSNWDPLIHFALFGRRERRRSAPGHVTFARYEELQAVVESHWFDERFYSDNNPEICEAGLDPLDHYVDVGAWEGRWPNHWFDPKHYLEAYPDVEATGINPLVHYWWVGRVGGRVVTPLPASVPSPPSADFSAGEFESQDAYEPQSLIEIGESEIRLIAFYLPQFHPFPENDRFWGKGFTEWTKTTKARPVFKGHQQPRHPGELGYYDLRIKEVQRRQIELAKVHGIAGFCYHYYWFDGKPVMRRPLEQFLDDPELDFPFCLHWANEPWTAAWDGCKGSGILLDQVHSPSDDLAFIQGIADALRDPRYIRIGRRPLLAVYRPGLFPDILATVDRWREYCLEAGIGELYLVVTQQPFDGRVDPRQYGFDAAVEFPPHNYPTVDVRDRLELFDPQFAGIICSYDEVVQASLALEHPDYTLFRGIMPGFDNTPRRENAGIYVGNTPLAYQQWLEGLCHYTRGNLPENERLIFVNAWNEWAEGAYLEPDRHHGYAYLNATSRALRNDAGRPGLRKIVFLGHDANRAGAQILLLHMLQWIAERTATELRIVLGTGGELLSRFQAISDVLVLDDQHQPEMSSEQARRRIVEFAGVDSDLVYANTVVAGEYLPLMQVLDTPVITHFHELEKSIRRFASPAALQNALSCSDRFIAASPPVADNLVANHGVGAAQIETVNAFIEPNAPPDSARVRDSVRGELGLGPEDVVVIGCGTRDWRKGPDLFVDVAEELSTRELPNWCFFWIGGAIGGEFPDLERTIQDRGLASQVFFLGPTDKPSDYFCAADIFLLPSREDPFPLVCLEAADCSLPVVCFAEAGGMPDFVETDAGCVVPYGDVKAMADAVAGLINDPTVRRARGAASRKKLHKRHTCEVSMPEIFHIIREVSGSAPLISVIIPSYNYERYMEQRLSSIFSQTFQDYEILIEDDCSTDGTLVLLSRYKSRRNLKVFSHPQNSGVFSMWASGLEKARGEIVWIAEEDDFCEPTFLERLLPSFDDSRVKLAYCQSYAIDEDGTVIGDYARCFPELSEDKWLQPYILPADQELEDGLAVKNFILNASAVLFRKPNVAEVRQLLRDFTLSGDWCTYLHVLRDGFVAYSTERLNYHRRHDASVVGRVAGTNLPVAEAGRIHRYVLENYSLNSQIKDRMEDYALSLWKERNPDTPIEQFWNTYEPEQHPQEG